MQIHGTFGHLLLSLVSPVVPKAKGFEAFRFKALSVLWCGPGLNRRHMDFQSIALPTELPHQLRPPYGFGAAKIGVYC